MAVARAIGLLVNNCLLPVQSPSLLTLIFLVGVVLILPVVMLSPTQYGEVTNEVSIVYFGNGVQWPVDAGVSGNVGSGSGCRVGNDCCCGVGSGCDCCRTGVNIGSGSGCDDDEEKNEEEDGDENGDEGGDSNLTASEKLTLVRPPPLPLPLLISLVVPLPLIL